MMTRALFALALTSAASPRLSSPNYISYEHRQLLHKRMGEHGRAALRLSMGVVLLSYDDVGEVADATAELPPIPRPAPGEQGTLSAALPARYFEFQDQLRLRAKELAQAASKRSNAKMSKAYQRLTETCMACHAVYLSGPGSEEEWWPSDALLPKDAK